MLAEQIWPYIFGLPQLALLMSCAIAMSGIIAYYWYKTQKEHATSDAERSANELKRSMVERGMSADEIERILSAGVPRDMHR